MLMLLFCLLLITKPTFADITISGNITLSGNLDINVEEQVSEAPTIPSDYIAYYEMNGDLTDEGGNYDLVNTNVAFAEAYDNGVAIFNGSARGVNETFPCEDADLVDGFSISGWYMFEEGSFDGGNNFMAILDNNPAYGGFYPFSADKNVSKPSGEDGCLRLGIPINNIYGDLYSKTIDLGLSVNPEFYNIIQTYDPTTNRFKVFLDGDKKFEADVRPFTISTTVSLQANMSVQGVTVDPDNEDIIVTTSTNGTNPQTAYIHKYINGALTDTETATEKGHYGGGCYLDGKLYVPVAQPIFDEVGESDTTFEGIARYNWSDLSLDTAFGTDGFLDLRTTPEIISLDFTGNDIIKGTDDLGGASGRTMFVTFKYDSRPTSGTVTRVIAGLNDILGNRYNFTFSQYHDATNDDVLVVYVASINLGSEVAEVWRVPNYLTEAKENTWITLALKYDDTTVTLRDSSGAVSMTLVTAPDGLAGLNDGDAMLVAIGGDLKTTETRYFDGTIRNFAIVDEALSTATIDSIIATDDYDFTQQANLAIWLPITESTASTGGIQDSSTNEYDCTTYQNHIATALDFYGTIERPAWMNSSPSALCHNGTHFFALFYDDMVVEYDNDFEEVAVYHIDCKPVGTVGYSEPHSYFYIGDGIEYDSTNDRFLINYHGALSFYIDSDFDNDSMVFFNPASDTVEIKAQGMSMISVDGNGDETYWITDRYSDYATADRAYKMTRNPVSTTYSPKGFTTLGIGGSGRAGLDGFNGAMTHIRLYDRPLTDSEIQLLSDELDL